jgi:glycosyltransferase involved in cell wall biosynthesis
VTISIVIATYNAGSCLAECLKSCLKQTWRDQELIVIDGGSTDNTVSIIRAFAQHITYWVSEPDNGIYDAWNKALQHVTGTWVLFRGADDVFWDASALEDAAKELMIARPAELVCYGSTVVTDQNSFVRRVQGGPWKEIGRRFFQEMTIPHPATFHHIDLFGRFGDFDTSYRVAGDYEFLLRVLSQPDVEAKFMTQVIVSRMFDGGNSAKHMFRSRLEEIRAKRHNGIPGLPLTQYWRILTNTKAVILKCTLRLLLGRHWSDVLYTWRRRQVSRGLQWRIDDLMKQETPPQET